MIGKTISHYKILEKLGEGGMGVVYKAEDFRLKRIVALKFLPPELTRDKKAKERFTQEAQAASALDHSNVCTIYEVNETEDGQMYMVMAYYAGETLKQKIARGALEVDEAVNTALQIAEGLSRAHKKGIVHRDIKPANIFVTDDGEVKIVDFGLAKLAGQVGLTKTGTTIGTVAYMSPEQSYGEDVDARTDIWSLGVVLYEMLTGRRPFKGAHEQAVVYSILNHDPDPVGRLRADVPAGVQHVVARAMRKNRDERFGELTAFIADLRAAMRTPQIPGAAPEARSRWRTPIPYILIATAFVLAVASFNMLFRSEGAPHSPPQYKQVTFLDEVRSPVLSADGKYLAYLARKQTGEDGLWVKDLDTGSAIETYSAPRCWLMGWSPDGSHLLFGAIHQESDMGTYIIPRLGGEPRKVFDHPWPWSAWSPDGSRVANLGVGVNEISIIDLSTGDTRGIELSVGTKRSGEVNYLDWSRTHDLLLFQIDDVKNQSFWTIKPDGTGQTLLMEVAYNPDGLIANPRWSPRGDAIYYLRFSVRGQGVMDLIKIPIDAKTGAKTGEPLMVLSGLHTGDEGYSISEDGARFLYVQETNYANIWMVTVEGEVGSFDVKKMQLTTGATWKSRAEISPDGSRIVFGMSTGEASNIYVMSLPDEVGGAETVESPRQLTFFNSQTDVPVWSPDGDEIAFYSTQGGTPRVWHMSSGGGTPVPFEEVEFESFVGDHLAWAPGRKIIHRTVGIRNFSIFDPTTGESSPLVDADSLGYVFGPCWSPGGGRIAFFWNREREKPPMGAWVKDMTTGVTWKIADTVVQPLTWTPDGEWIWGMRYDVRAGGLNDVFKIPNGGGEPIHWVNLPFDKVDSGRISLTPDGRRFIYSKIERHADAWIVENFDPNAD